MYTHNHNKHNIIISSSNYNKAPPQPIRTPRRARPDTFLYVAQDRILLNDKLASELEPSRNYIYVYIIEREIGIHTYLVVYQHIYIYIERERDR